MIEKFIKEFKKEGYSPQTILINFLPDVVDDICEEWGLMEYNVPISCLFPARSSDLINNEKQLLEASNTKFGSISILESGDVYKIETETVKTGGVTWNGDDEYFTNFKINIVQSYRVETIENLKNLTDVTAEMLKQIACEVVATLYQ